MMRAPRGIARPLPSFRRQRGVTLLIGMIMLVLLTLLALSAFNTSNVNLRVVGNMQLRQEAQAAANQAIAEALSSAAFTNNPAVGTTPIYVDVNQDTTPDYTVTLTPNCLSSIPIPNKDLDPDPNSDDAKCFTGGGFGAGASGGTSSLCSNSTWDIQARAVDVANTGTDTTIHQGVAVRISVSEQDTYCK